MSALATMGFGTQTYVSFRSHTSSRAKILTNPQKGIIIKWIILGVLFALFMAWFVGGYIHAKQRLKKGLPLLGYHRVRPFTPSQSHRPANITPNSS